MSREPDNPSSTPPRPGADAYPSGTPPYGGPSDPPSSRAGQPQNQQPQPAEEPRTETTLTTRIRINIPGSRPIPPVVVRSPMPGANGSAAAGSAPERAEAPGFQDRAAELTDRQDAAFGPGAPRHRSDVAPSPVLGVMESTAGPRTAAPDLPPEWRTQAQSQAAEPPADAPSTWFAPRKKGPAAPEEPQSEPRPAAQPVSEPFRFDTPAAADPAPRRTFEPPTYEAPVYEAPGRPLLPYGDAPLPPSPSAPTPPPQQPFPPAYQQQPYGQPRAAAAQAPAPPQATAPMPTLAPRPAPGGGRPPGVNGGLTMGVPETSTPGTAPGADAGASLSDGFAGGTGGVGAPPRKPSTSSSPESPAAAAAPRPKGKRASGRARKLVVTGIVALAMVSGVAYGAGLMLNQSDVPKGTTVLGQNIGGDTRDAAVHTLDGTVGKIAVLPLQLVVGTRTIPLDPSVAGLTIDTTATVQNVAHHSYNPIWVFESLGGGDHPAAPVVKIDQDKLRSALQQLVAGDASSVREGSVHFTSDGSVLTVTPQSGQSLDVNAAMALVQQAYQNRAAGQPDKPITLPVTTAAPKVTADAVNAAADSIGKWAMRTTFTVKIHGVSHLFGKITFSKCLTLQPDASGTLVPTFDLAKLQETYSDTFKSVKVKHNGTPGPVTPQDIATALTQLLEKPNGDHSVTLD